MSLDKQQFKIGIIKPILKEMKAYSKEASNLIWGTISQESLRGRYIRQIGCSHSVGGFGMIQMELATAKDILNNYIEYRPNLQVLYHKYYNQELTLKQNLTGNMHFQVFMCRCHYLRVPESIPTYTKGQAMYWKKHYNTVKGKGTAEDYMRNIR